MLAACRFFLFVYCLEEQVLLVAAMSIAGHRQPRGWCPLEWGSEVSLCGIYSFGKGLEHVLYYAVLKMVTMVSLFSVRKSDHI